MVESAVYTRPRSIASLRRRAWTSARPTSSAAIPGRRDGLHASTLAVTTCSFAAVGSASSMAARPELSPRDTRPMQLGHQTVDLGPRVVRARFTRGLRSLDGLKGLHRHLGRLVGSTGIGGAGRDPEPTRAGAQSAGAADRVHEVDDQRDEPEAGPDETQDDAGGREPTSGLATP